MFFIVNDPGPWQSYVRRADNIGLPLMEVKQKYLKEQALFENEQRRQYYEYMRMIHDSRGGPGSSGPGIAFGGQGIDGPIVGATVTALAEGVSTTTDANGEFFFTFVPTGGFELTGGTDSVTGVPFTGTLKAPSGSRIVSPITTAIKEVMDRHGHSEADATTYVFNYANKIYGIDVPPAARERAKTENFITLGETDADMLKVAGLSTVFESSAEVAGKAYAEQITGLTAGVTMTLKEGKESFYKSLAGMVHNRRTSTEPSDSVSNELAKGLRESTIRMVGFSGRPANLIQYSHINHAMDQTLNRVKEVVNDATLDKDYAMAAVMAQNRIAKQDFTSFVGTNGTVGLLFNSSSILVNTKETEAVDNLGTIFKGKENRKAPSATRFAESINYISGSTNSQLNFGSLTRAGEFNDTAYYTGVIDGEATTVWYDTTNRSWVIDNNLTLPAIAVGTTRQAYPLNRQKFRATDGREIQLIEPQAGGGGTTITVADDGLTQILAAPTGSGRYINSYASRLPRGVFGDGAVIWSSVTAQFLGTPAQRVWYAQGDIYLGTLDLGATVGDGRTGGIKLSGNFKITNNALSIEEEQTFYSPNYVISKHPEEALNITINTLGNIGIATPVTSLSLGLTRHLLLTPEITTTGGFNPYNMNNVAGIFET